MNMPLSPVAGAFMTVFEEHHVIALQSEAFAVPATP